MIEKLDLARDVVNEMKLETVHRIGPFSQNPNYDRKIVCKFNLFADKELVRKRLTILRTIYMSSFHQKSSPNEGDWSQSFVTPRRRASLLGSPTTHCTWRVNR